MPIRLYQMRRLYLAIISEPIFDDILGVRQRQFVDQTDDGLHFAIISVLIFDDIRGAPRFKGRCAYKECI